MPSAKAAHRQGWGVRREGKRRSSERTRDGEFGSGDEGTGWRLGNR